MCKRFTLSGCVSPSTCVPPLFLLFVLEMNQYQYYEVCWVGSWWIDDNG